MSTSLVLVMNPWRRDSRGKYRAPRGALKPAFVHLVVASALACSLAGCGNTLYATHIAAASKRFEEAETIGAEEAAPYEYYSAKVRIAESRALAARGEYGDAMRIARQAEKYSIKARDKTEAHKRTLARQQQTAPSSSSTPSAANSAASSAAMGDGLPAFEDAEAP